MAFGEFGLMALEPGLIRARQIEAGRVTAAHFMGKGGRFWIRIFPHKPVSRKPAETRMGKGKGEPEFYAAVVKPGQIMFEVGGVDENFAKQCMNLIAHKMPLRTKMVTRRHTL